MYNAIERGIAKRSNLIEIKHISIDEKSFKRGHE